jgi:hypothetical protein
MAALDDSYIRKGMPDPVLKNSEHREYKNLYVRGTNGGGRGLRCFNQIRREGHIVNRLCSFGAYE